MTIEEKFKTVGKVIGHHLFLDPGVIKLEDTLEQLGADSLDRIEILVDIEAEYDIQFEHKDFYTVGEIINAI